MGLFSRKSSKEKRIKKFNKTEEKVIKLIDDLGLCPIFELFRHAMEEKKKKKTGEHFLRKFQKRKCSPTADFGACSI